MTTTKNYTGLREVSDRQLAAIEALVGGATHAEAAEKAGVHRVTVSKWAAGHPGFQAELNRRRRELNEQWAARLQELDEAALDAAAAKLDSKDPDFALKWLKLRGLSSAIHSVGGPTDADEIIDGLVKARRDKVRSTDFDNQLDPTGRIDPARLREEVEAELARTYEPDNESF